MGFSFTNSTIELLKSKIDIVDVIGRSISLKKKGANYQGLCPFHGEKTPSFVVSKDKQIFTCFGCGASGDAIEFVKRYYNLDFSETIEKIAKEEGIQLEKSSYNSNLDEYYKANALAAKFFFNSFVKQKNQGLSYMLGRGLKPETLKKFGIGYADSQWDSLYKYLNSQGISQKIMTSLGLVSSSKGKIYDRFRNRVMFPIINTSGKVIGFGGRALEGDTGAKYINSPENPIFHKSNNLFALNFSRQLLRNKEYIIIVEGYMDAISLYQAGIENVAASLGTALTENHAKIIKRYVKRVVLSYDSDNAGRNAAYKAIDTLRAVGLDVRVLHVDDGKDPDEYIKAHGKERFLKLIEDAVPGLDYQFSHRAMNYNMESSLDKIAFFKDIKDIFNRMDPVERDLYAKKLGKKYNVSYQAILNQESSTNEELRKTNNSVANPVDTGLSLVEKTLLKVMFMENSYIVKIDQPYEIFKSDLGRRIYDLLLQELNNGSDFIDENIIKDQLEPTQVAILEDIILNVNILDEEKVFTDCVRSNLIERLQQREKQLLDLLFLAEEEDQIDKLEPIQRELIEVQKKIKLQRGEVI